MTYEKYILEKVASSFDWEEYDMNEIYNLEERGIYEFEVELNEDQAVFYEAEIWIRDGVRGFRISDIDIRELTFHELEPCFDHWQLAKEIKKRNYNI